MNIDNRRPIASRNNHHIAALAAAIARRAYPTPNQISVLSAVFAIFGALLLLVPHWVAYGLCALAVQLRLLCNLLDGMVAVEGGKKTPNGQMFNEFPDRVADSALLVALGYATPYPWLGWLAALLALGTAYIRVFGGSLGLAQSFAGPFAKQQRMAVLTLACLLAAVEAPLWGTRHALTAALCIITLGTAYTCWRRSAQINRALRQQG